MCKTDHYGVELFGCDGVAMISQWHRNANINLRIASFMSYRWCQLLYQWENKSTKMYGGHLILSTYVCRYQSLNSSAESMHTFTVHYV